MKFVELWYFISAKTKVQRCRKQMFYREHCLRLFHEMKRDFMILRFMVWNLLWRVSKVLDPLIITITATTLCWCWSGQDHHHQHHDHNRYQHHDHHDRHDHHVRPDHHDRHDHHNRHDHPDHHDHHHHDPHHHDHDDPRSQPNHDHHIHHLNLKLRIGINLATFPSSQYSNGQESRSL